MNHDKSNREGDGEKRTHERFTAAVAGNGKAGLSLPAAVLCKSPAREP